ncbi:kinase-like domain-containing protein [Fusarium avenaceum]|nr:kinase-like domain-containing protein [Fusarium avenaceum]
MIHIMISKSTRIPARVRSFPSSRFNHLYLTRYHHTEMEGLEHRCNIDAEPLHRYKPDGYHPLALGEVLNNGRYKIIHKLGWGGYSTTWAAKDEQTGRYVAVKIPISEAEKTNEYKVLQAISTLPKHHPGFSHVNQLLDTFTLVGPNGSHNCLVLEIVGPSVADIVEGYCKDDRLSSELARVFSKQALQGLDFLAQNNIGHGVTRVDGKPVEHNLPTHLLLSSPVVKIIDFGEAFFNSDAPTTLHTPLSIFELITGQPPFDSMMITPPNLVSQMIGITRDELPSKWQAKWKEMNNGKITQPEVYSPLKEWMQEVYFDDYREVEFTEKDILRAAELIDRMLKMEPSLRAVPSEILSDTWFD